MADTTNPSYCLVQVCISSILISTFLETPHIEMEANGYKHEKKSKKTKLKKPIWVTNPAMHSRKTFESLQKRRGVEHSITAVKR